MTTNQIAYFSAKEQQRHNLAIEKETGRHNVVEETTQKSHFERMDAETLRHNMATEQQARDQLQLGYAQLDLGNRQLEETQRHNYASESLQLASLNETSRHNKVSESIAAHTLNETIAHNRETERMQDELNGSVITSNYGNYNRSNREAELAAARTETEKKQQSFVEAQQKYTEQKTLTEKKATKYYGAKSVSEITRNYGSAVGSVLGSVTKILGVTSGFQAGTSAGMSALDQIERQFDAMLAE